MGLLSAGAFVRRCFYPLGLLSVGLFSAGLSSVGLLSAGLLSYTQVDHVAWYLLYVKCLCVLSCDLSPVVEIWIILSGMFRSLDNKKYKEKKKKKAQPRPVQNFLNFLIN